MEIGMAALGQPGMTNYNPMNVLFGRPQGDVNRSGGWDGPTPKTPYVSTTPTTPTPGPSAAIPPAPAATGYVAPESIRAIGSGPFDPAYRQDLATFAGGPFARSGGSMEFNPTGPLNFGQPSGGGTAPTYGLPMTLLGEALGGNPFRFAAPASSVNMGAGGGDDEENPLRFWLQKFLDSNFGLET